MLNGYEMLNECERLELIRQAEKTNLSNEQMDQLIEWAESVRFWQHLLDLLFDGQIEVASMREDEPYWAITEKGKKSVEEDFPFFDDEDYDIDDLSAYDTEGINIVEMDENDEIDLSHIEDPEKANEVLKDLLKKLESDKRSQLENNGDGDD